MSRLVGLFRSKSVYWHERYACSRELRLEAMLKAAFHKDPARSAAAAAAALSQNLDSNSFPFGVAI